MALINAIPAELVHEILSHIQPEDIENFAQISRYIYTNAAPFLLEHRARCRNHYAFESDLGADREIARSEYLKELLDDPSIGRYVRSIRLLIQRGDSNVQEQTHELPRENLHIISQQAGEAGLFDCCFTSSSRSVRPSEWLWHARIFEEPLLLALLLMRFPKTNSLVVEAGFLDTRRMTEFYDLLQEITSLPSSALSKVSKIHLWPSILHTHSVLDVQRFCALPSIKCLSAPDLSPKQGCDFVEWELTTLYFAKPNSTITRLDLGNCAASAECLYEFLQDFTSLETFKYSSAEPTESSSTTVPHFNPFMIRSGLMSHSATTLRVIVLLAHPNDLAPPFMGSLRRFSALTELRTTYSCLMGKDSYCQELGQTLPGSICRLALDGRKCARSSNDMIYHEHDPVEDAVQSAVSAKEGHGIRPFAPIEKLKELIFTGYKGFGGKADKELMLRLAEKVSLAVKFAEVGELDHTRLANPH